MKFMQKMITASMKLLKSLICPNIVKEHNISTGGAIHLAPPALSCSHSLYNSIIKIIDFCQSYQCFPLHLINSASHHMKQFSPFRERQVFPCELIYNLLS